MTIVSLGGTLAPGFIAGGAGSASLNTHIIDAAGEKSALKFNPPRAGNITKIHWATRTVTTGDTLDVRLETVSSGFPSGTLWGTNTNGSATVLASDDNARFATTLTSAAAVTMDDLLALVIVCSAGNLQIACITRESMLPASGGFPIGYLYTTSWAGNAGLIVAVLEYDDGVMMPAIPGASFYNSFSTPSFSSASTPDERGNIFEPVAPIQVNGFTVAITAPAGASTTIKLMDSSDNVLATQIVDTDTRTTSYGIGHYKFDVAVNLTAGQSYRITATPNATAVALQEYAEILGTPQIAAMSSFYKTSRTDAGAWTDDSTVITHLFPIISGIDDGASTGGGLLTHPGMSGGMRG